MGQNAPFFVKNRPDSKKVVVRMQLALNFIS